jgi:hypothetical protein
MHVVYLANIVRFLFTPVMMPPTLRLASKCYMSGDVGSAQTARIYNFRDPKKLNANETFTPTNHLDGSLREARAVPQVFDCHY